jgi:polyisoprenoid-binding protein YceI
MKNIFYPLMAATILLTSAMNVAPSQDFKIADGYSIAFKSKDPSGVFKTMKGTVKFDEADLPNSKFDLQFVVSSISTGNGMMNKKAQIEEWFNAAKYPEIKFTSTKVVKSGSDYSVSGKLTIKGISKEKSIPLKATKVGANYTFSGSFTVNRMDFKVGHKSDAVPDVMNISYSIPVLKK